MGVVDPKFGGEVITKKGKVYKFDDVICMGRFYKSRWRDQGSMILKRKLVINAEKENDFLDVSKTIFWVSPELRSPMGSNAAAFSSHRIGRKSKDGKRRPINELG